MVETVTVALAVDVGMGIERQPQAVLIALQAMFASTLGQPGQFDVPEVTALEAEVTSELVTALVAVVAFEVVAARFWFAVAIHVVMVVLLEQVNIIVSSNMQVTDVMEYSVTGAAV